MTTALLRKLPSFASALALALPLAGLSAAARAQPSPAAPPNAANSSGPTSGRTPDTAHAQPAAAAPAAGGQTDQRLETHLKHLHDKLGITGSEEAAWQKVADVMRQNADTIRQNYQQRSSQVGSMTALDNLRSYAGMAQARAEEAQKMLAAFQPLYDQMSPEQKAKADQVFRAQAERREERAREMHGQHS